MPPSRILKLFLFEQRERERERERGCLFEGVREGEGRRRRRRRRRGREGGGRRRSKRMTQGEATGQNAKTDNFSLSPCSARRFNALLKPTNSPCALVPLAVRGRGPRGRRSGGSGGGGSCSRGSNVFGERWRRQWLLRGRRCVDYRRHRCRAEEDEERAHDRYGCWNTSTRRQGRRTSHAKRRAREEAKAGERHKKRKGQRSSLVMLCALFGICECFTVLFFLHLLLLSPPLPSFS